MSPPSREKRSRGPRRAGATSPPTNPTPPAPGGGAEPGVLSSLPSTRPQRPSARRAAARKSAAAQAERGSVPSPKRGEGKPKRAVRTVPAPAAKPRVTRKPAEPAVPRQGFESEETIEMGHSVQPPSGSELAASMVELVGELAQTGLSAGGHVLRDALTRLAGG